MKLVLIGLLFSAFIVSTLAISTEEAEESPFVQIDRCYQYKDCTGASFSKQAIAVKSTCCNMFGGQSYILTDGSVCRNW